MLILQWLILVTSSSCAFSKVQSLEDVIAVENNNRRIIHNVGSDVKLSRIKKIRQSPSSTSDDEDDKKTLAQQVADGKYGLIQTELFSKPVKRPGILSYEINPEVPKDNVNNFGGLQPEEIWLAENHLLVLKGGGFSDKGQEGKSVWPPIDNYIAPTRQVKIPPNPKVPPPFPVQLTEGGPIEIIKGKNGSIGPPPFFNPRFPPPYPLPDKSDFGNGTHHENPPPGNFSVGNGPLPFPFPLPGVGLYPPAIAFLPPPGNFTELDEDDPSIYYPPPYDFIYQKDNSSHIPPGPLVPGIILPPPPNFFAPLENKTRTSSRPTKTKDSGSRGRKIEKGGSTTVTTDSPRPTTIPSTTVKTETRKNTGTKTTTQQSTTTGTDQNEVNSLPTLPPNTPVGGWVPIPAPRPFYISEIKTKFNPQQDNFKIPFEKPKNGWEYENATNSEEEQYYRRRPGHWNSRYLPTTTARGKKGRYFTTTPEPYSGFKPIYVRTQEKLTTNAPSQNYPYPAGVPGEGEPRETYYFYEEPHITEGKLIDTDIQSYTTPKKIPKQYFQYKQKQNFETNTLTPPQYFEDVTAKTPTPGGQIAPVPKFKYYEASYVKPVPSSQPAFEYYYYNQGSRNPGYSYDPHLGPSAESSLGPIGPYPTKPVINLPRQNKKMNHNQFLNVQPTSKPPIYEYSYSAPGYGTIEAPKVGSNFATTAKPVVYESNFSPMKDQPYDYYSYETTPKHSNVYRYHQRDPRPQYYTTARPNYENEGTYSNLGLYQTEAPYNYFTHHDVGLLDDITKKYFSLFGQKLNPDAINEGMTTPLPSGHSSGRKQPYYDGDTPTTTEKPKQNIKFPDEAYSIQNERPYYTPLVKPQGYRAKYRMPQRTQKPANIQKPYFSASSPQFHNYDQYQGIVRPNHPLDSDIDVNYKNPHPSINPEAEIIDPHYISPHLRDNSYISYQLPGSGGHFYFLTPQTVNAENYHLANSGLRYPDPEKTGYYKRNVDSEKSRSRNVRIQK